MSLKARFLWILASVSFLLLVASGFSLFILMGRSLSELELVTVQKDMHRIQANFDQRFDALSAFTGDWAAWDDAYAFMQDRNQDFIDSNLVLSTFTDTPLNLVAFYDVQGQMVWSRLIDLETETEIDAEEFPKTGFLTGHPLIILGESEEGKSGLFATGHGPMILSAQSILTSDGDGPSRGTLVMGRFLTDDLIHEIAGQVQIPLALWQTDDPAMPVDIYAATRGLALGETVIGGSTTGISRPAYAILPDITGHPFLALRADLDRAAFVKTGTALVSALILLITCGAIVLGLTYILVNRFVVAPLSVLTSHVVQLGETGDFSKTVTLPQKDELGIIATEINKMQARIAKLAHYDILTGLANRILFMDRAEQALAQAKRANKKMALIYVDLDKFKNVNDTLGHPAGDYLLQDIANRLIAAVRMTDTVARLGGDEFAIVVSNIHNSQELALICEKLLEGLADPVFFNGHKLQPAASIGASIYPDDAPDIESLLRHADQMMYMVKKSAPGRYRIHGR